MQKIDALTQEARADAERFIRAHIILARLRENRDRLTYQQYSTIRGQALAGDIDGARRGLARLMGWEDSYEEENDGYD